MVGELRQPVGGRSTACRRDQDPLLDHGPQATPHSPRACIREPRNLGRSHAIALGKHRHHNRFGAAFVAGSIARPPRSTGNRNERFEEIAVLKFGILTRIESGVFEDVSSPTPQFLCTSDLGEEISDNGVFGVGSRLSGVSGPEYRERLAFFVRMPSSSITSLAI